jgi:hypothetical protein
MRRVGGGVPPARRRSRVCGERAEQPLAPAAFASCTGRCGFASWVRVDTPFLESVCNYRQRNANARAREHAILTSALWRVGLTRAHCWKVIITQPAATHGQTAIYGFSACQCPVRSLPLASSRRLTSRRLAPRPPLALSLSHDFPRPIPRHDTNTTRLLAQHRPSRPQHRSPRSICSRRVYAWSSYAWRRGGVGHRTAYSSLSRVVSGGAEREDFI